VQRELGAVIADVVFAMQSQTTAPRNSRRFDVPHTGTRTSRLLTLSVTLAAGSGCLAPGEDEVHVSETTQAATVSTYTSSGCSTAVVLGLSKQIADEVSCINPTGLRRFASSSRIQLTSNAVMPYLSSVAKTNLESLASTRTVQINSAFRTVAQQYLLYRWKQQGRCGIAAAATPGRSNHESGRALDVANYSALASTFVARGWSRVAGDAVHFDHRASPDIRGLDVRAFQRLWNRNNPGDKIAEDGAYGSATEARLRKAPATGFARGASCTSGAFITGADVVSVDGPDRMEPASQAQYALVVRNHSALEWPASAVLRRPGASPSQLSDDSWMSTTEILQLGIDVPPQSDATMVFQVSAPMVSDETPISEQLELADGSTVLGTFTLALTVIPGLGEPTSAEGDDLHDDGEDGDASAYTAELSGGCSTGGSTGAGALLLVAAVTLPLRRRQRRA
jgi:MYXO-CTERM domain-containing protein